MIKGSKLKTIDIGNKAHSHTFILAHFLPLFWIRAAQKKNTTDELQWKDAKSTPNPNCCIYLAYNCRDFPSEKRKKVHLLCWRMYTLKQRERAHHHLYRVGLLDILFRWVGIVLNNVQSAHKLLSVFVFFASAHLRSVLWHWISNKR